MRDMISQDALTGLMNHGGEKDSFLNKSKGLTTFLASADKLMYTMKEIAHAREESESEESI